MSLPGSPIFPHYSSIMEIRDLLNSITNDSYNLSARFYRRQYYHQTEKIRYTEEEYAEHRREISRNYYLRNKDNEEYMEKMRTRTHERFLKYGKNKYNRRRDRGDSEQAD